MSTLTTEERLALDEIFLSMAIHPSPFRNVKTMMHNVSRTLRTHTFSRRAKELSSIYPMRKTLRYTRLWVRTGCLTCAKRLRLKH